LLGEDASGRSPSTISRLCKEWEIHHERFRKRHLGFSRYAYLFVDGVHVSVRLGEDDKLCLLVVVGVREDGTKELLAVEDGYRESTESWAGVFRDMKRRGLGCPKLVVGDGALGAWAALRDVFPDAGEQRCWVQKDSERARLPAQAAAAARQDDAARDHRGAHTQGREAPPSRRSARSSAPSTRRRSRSSARTGSR
jgi:transposase-like protein